MVFDNRIYNEMDKDPDVNAQIDNINPEAEIARDTDASDEINSEADMRAAFSNIREEVQKSLSSADLTELFRQAGSLIKLLDMPTFEQKVGADIDEIRKVAEEEFASTARELNRRAVEVGARSRYAEKWGD